MLQLNMSLLLTFACVATSRWAFRPDRLAGARRRAKLTQEDLAAKMDRTVAAIRAWEQGRKVPPLRALCDLAQLLGVSPNELCGAEPTQESSTLLPA